MSQKARLGSLRLAALAILIFIIVYVHQFFECAPRLLRSDPLPHGCAPKCRADLHFSAVFYGTEQGNFIDVFEAAADRDSVRNARNADAEGSSFAM